MAAMRTVEEFHAGLDFIRHPVDKGLKRPPPAGVPRCAQVILPLVAGTTYLATLKA
jgi:hypothetical protein